MATSNNDRVSSQRLLDTLKGLQASRHLGSEPEVSTETVEYPAIVSPAAGTYQTNEDLLSAINEPNDNRLPFRVYVDSGIELAPNSFPLTIPTPTGDYVELTKKISGGNNASAYVQADFPDDLNTSNYSGYVLMQENDVWMAAHLVNGDVETNFYIWEMPAYTENITTETKRPIKQAYLPNADWSVNDPDADGYVEGRTHWEEVNDVSGTINVQSGAITGNFAFGDCDKFGKIKSFSYPNGSFVAEQPSDMIEAEGGQYYFAGEDSNGNAISMSSVQDLETAMQTATIGLILMNANGSTMCYIAYPNVTQGDVCSVELVNEVIHKLPRKFYDYTEPVDYDGLDKKYKKYDDVDIKNNIQLFKSELKLTTTTYPSFEIAFNDWTASIPFQPINGKKYANGSIDYLILFGIYHMMNIDASDLYKYILLNGNLYVVDSQTDEETLITFDHEDGNVVYMKNGNLTIKFTIYANGLRWNYTNAPTVLRVRQLPVVKNFNKKFYSTTKYDILNDFVPEVNDWSSLGPIKAHLGNIIYGNMGSFRVIAKAKLNVWYKKLQSNETISKEANQWYEIGTIPVQAIYFYYKMVDGVKAYTVQQYQITEGNIIFDIAVVYGGKKYQGTCASVYIKWSDDLHNLPNSNNKNVEIDLDGTVASNYTYVKITDPLMIAANITD